MMSMINANFTKQDNQTAAAGDAGDKEVKPDEFMQLLAGLCPAPQTDPKTVASEPELPAHDGPLDPAINVLDETPATGGNIKPDTLLIKDAALTDINPPVKTPADPISVLQKNVNGPDDCITPFQPIDVPVKPLVKDLKTQLNKFEKAPIPPGQISVGQNFAAMAKAKNAAVDLLTQLQSGSVTSPTDGSSAGVDDTHFDHTYVTGSNSISMGDGVWSSTRLPKLIKHVTDIVVSDKVATTIKDIAQQVIREVAPKVATMLEQIEPKMMELAAATMTNSKQILKMKLHPAELGTVEIRLEKSETGVLSAHFRTDNDTARDLLAKSMNQLRESLQNAGYNIGQVEISSSPFSHGDSQAQKDAWQQVETAPELSDKPSSQQSPKISDDLSQHSADRLVSLRA